MFAVVALLFLVVPFAELFVLINVGQTIGTFPTVGLLLVVSVVGAVMVEREGLGILQNAQEQVRAGRVPAAELFDGVLILFAGGLLVSPGFLTDVLGILLLIKPVRQVLRTGTAKWLAKRHGRATVGVDEW